MFIIYINMRKIIISLFVLVVCIAMTSCDVLPNGFAKDYGATLTVDLDKGQELVECTWKDEGDLWVLTKPMDEDYEPQVKIFKEYSNLGIVNGKVIFKEHK